MPSQVQEEHQADQENDQPDYHIQCWIYRPTQLGHSPSEYENDDHHTNYEDYKLDHEANHKTFFSGLGLFTVLLSCTSV